MEKNQRADAFINNMNSSQRGVKRYPFVFCKNSEKLFSVIFELKSNRRKEYFLLGKQRGVQLYGMEEKRKCEKHHRSNQRN